MYVRANTEYCVDLGWGTNRAGVRLWDSWSEERMSVYAIIFIIYFHYRSSTNSMKHCTMPHAQHRVVQPNQRGPRRSDDLLGHGELGGLHVEYMRIQTR